MRNDNLINVLYLTWGEQISNAGIIGNQVFGQVKTIANLGQEINIQIMSGIPIYSRAYLHDKKQLLNDHNELRQELNNYGITLNIRYISILPRYFYSKFHITPLYYLNHLNYFREFIDQNSINIVHCRSYHATNLALQVKRKYNMQYKIIFDTRGLFPEEAVFRGDFSENSLSYKAWKNRERIMLDDCDAIVNVSDTFTEYIASLTDNPNIFTIYTSVNMDVFKKNEKTRQNIRHQLGISDQEKILVYSGFIGKEGWHRVSSLVRVFKEFQKAFSKTRLLVVTLVDHSLLRLQLAEEGLGADSFLLVKGNNPEQTNAYLQAADYSCLPYKTVKDNIEAIVSKTMVASKTGEYFAVGLPLIVNDAVGAASRLVEKYGIGCTYPAGREDKINKAVVSIDSNYETVSNNCVKVARNYFSSDKNAKAYIDIYHQLMG
jgi:glycosyltransferase involved in cell wall biosynthesis